MIQEGGKRKSKVSMKSMKSKKSKKSMKSMKGGDAPVALVQDGGAKKRRSKKSKKSMKGGAVEVQDGGAKRRSKKSSKKVSKKVSKKGSKKSRREANPQITVRGALVKYVWDNLDVKKTAAEKGMHPIGIPAKIVQMVMVEAMKEHPTSEENKKSAAHWSTVQKAAMKLLADNLPKYASMVKKA